MRNANYNKVPFNSKLNIWEWCRKQGQESCTCWGWSKSGGGGISFSTPQFVFFFKWLTIPLSTMIEIQNENPPETKISQTIRIY